jgi:hypothetical protein
MILIIPFRSEIIQDRTMHEAQMVIAEVSPGLYTMKKSRHSLCNDKPFDGQMLLKILANPKGQFQLDWK